MPTWGNICPSGMSPDADDVSESDSSDFLPLRGRSSSESQGWLKVGLSALPFSRSLGARWPPDEMIMLISLQLDPMPEELNNTRSGVRGHFLYTPHYAAAVRWLTSPCAAPTFSQSCPEDRAPAQVLETVAPDANSVGWVRGWVGGSLLHRNVG